jgi:O-acetyl-ADP-ribose deacetylase (regulator of RNase III)
MKRLNLIRVFNCFFFFFFFLVSKTNIVRLSIDAIVNPTNEALNSKHGISLDIVDAGGDALRNELLLLDGCKTGHAKATKAHGSIAAKVVIHTVGPRFNAKYLTAAENALHNCYRNTLHCLREEGLRHIAFSVVHSQRKGYPPDTGAHVALRTIRRYLEHHGENIDTVVLCMVEGEVNYGVYRNILPLYFPRTAEEFEKARDALPADTGDDWGETQIAERQIRIDVAPIAVVTDAGVLSAPAAEADTRSASTAAFSSSSSSSSISRFSSESTVVSDDQIRPADLANMTLQNDSARRHAVRQKAGGPTVAPERVEYYTKLRDELARTRDLSDIARLGYVYRAGPDAMGRDIVVIVAARLPVRTVNLRRVMLYLVDVLLPLTSRSFSVVYIHGGITAESDAPFSWLRQIYELLDWPHGEQLQSVHVVHPTFLLKMAFTMFSPFLSTQFSDKVRYVDGLKQLFELYKRESLQLADVVFEIDRRETGTQWNAAPRGAASTSTKSEKL